MPKTRLDQWKGMLERLSNQREHNVNRYIIPIEMKMSDLRDKIRNAEAKDKNNGTSRFSGI